MHEEETGYGCKYGVGGGRPVAQQREKERPRFRPPTSPCHEHWVETELRTLSTNQRGMKIVSVPTQPPSTLITSAKSQRSASEPVDLEKRT
jgi:hypothetical protein